MSDVELLRLGLSWFYPGQRKIFWRTVRQKISLFYPVLWPRNLSSQTQAFSLDSDIKKKFKKFEEIEKILEN